MQVIPSLDIQSGRSRLVWWPGASTGAGVPTDRPAVIAGMFAALGAPAIHVVDLDGAARGRPANLEAIGAIARAVARPLQLAGGVDGPEQVEIAFAAGATRVVMPMWAVAEDRPLLLECLRIAGDWLAVGIDARAESLSAYPWRHRARPELGDLLVELHAAGVRRFVISHLTDQGDIPSLTALDHQLDAEFVVAGGIASMDDLARLRDQGIAAVILGEVLFTGAIDLEEAIRSVA